MEPAHFRPIGLCSVSFKIITKIIVARLRELMPKLISPFQNGFVPGRHIGDNVMLAHELLHTMHKKKSSNHHYLALKLDLEKAYDRLEWPFLKLALTKYNFHPLIIYLIMQCVTTTSSRSKLIPKSPLPGPPLEGFARETRFPPFYLFCVKICLLLCWFII